MNKNSNISSDESAEILNSSHHNQHSFIQTSTHSNKYSFQSAANLSIYQNKLSKFFSLS